MKVFKVLFVLFFFSTNIFSQSIAFDAKGMLFLHDADFNTFSYVTGNIFKDKNNTDKISSFIFPLKYDEAISETIISNSIFNNAKTIALKSDNKTCYVLESRAAFKKEESNILHNIKNTPSGGFVSVVDISNLRKIQADYRFPVANNPTAISLNKTNDYLAISAEDSDHELQIFELNELGKPIGTVTRTNVVGNGTISDIQWHPSGNYLAFVKKESKEVGFLKVIREETTNKIIKVELLGNIVKLNGMPVFGQFSKNGKYFYVLDKKNEANTKSFSNNGQLFEIKITFEGSANHVLVSKADVESNPSSFCVHPSGKWLLVLNMKKAFDYPMNVLNSNIASISVLSLENEENIINKNNYQIEGILPTSIVFDKTGNNFAISNFQFFSFGKSFGGIDFYRFFPNENGKIEKQNSRIYTNVGIHYLKVIEDY